MSVDNDMKIAEPWHCGDCVHFRRCSALIGSLKGDEPHCDFAPSRFKLDTIGVLCRLVSDAGLVMTFQGEPVTADELRGIGKGIVTEKIRAALARKPLEGQ